MYGAIRRYFSQLNIAQRIAHLLPLILILTVLLGWLLIVQSNRKGTLAWERQRQRLTEAGETLSIGDLLLPEIPAASNFAATPALEGLRLEANAAKRTRLESLIDWSRPGHEDYKEFWRSSRNQDTSKDLGDLLAYLEEKPPGTHEALPTSEVGSQALALIDTAIGSELLAELAAAAKLPGSQLVPVWDEFHTKQERYGAKTPHFDSIQSLTRIYTRRALAATYAGDEDRFIGSVEVLLKIGHATLAEPMMTGQILGITVLRQMNNVIWTALAQGNLSNSSLDKIADLLKSTDLKRDYLQVIRVEMTHSLDVVPVFLASTKDIRYLDDRWQAVVLVGTLREGITGRSLAFLGEHYYDYIIEPTRNGWPALAKSSQELDAKINGPRKANLEKLLVDLVMPVQSRVADNVIYSEADLRLLTVAISLEQYSRENGRYPDSLSNLVPIFLKEVPQDPVTGNLIHYKNAPEGCTLWCVGFDSEDDGGKIIPPVEEGEDLPKFSRRDYQGDWVWKSSGK